MSKVVARDRRENREEERRGGRTRLNILIPSDNHLASTDPQPISLLVVDSLYVQPQLILHLVYIMPKIRTSRTKPPPEGFEDIQSVPSDLTK